MKSREWRPGWKTALRLVLPLLALIFLAALAHEFAAELRIAGNDVSPAYPFTNPHSSYGPSTLTTPNASNGSGR